MAKIGLLSDSHGRAAITARAAMMLVEAGAGRLIHLGDIETETVIDALTGLNDAQGKAVAVHIVFGNCDWKHEALGRYAQYLDITVDHPVGRMELDGQILAYQHGHEARRMQAALADEVNWLCHGHTHLQRDERIGKTRVINPGALYRAMEYSVALLDTTRDDVTFYPVAKD